MPLLTFGTIEFPYLIPNMASPRVDKIVKGNLVFHSHSGDDFTVTNDTKANILASTATEGKLAYATDTYEFYVANGSSWYKVPFALVSESANPDMGMYSSNSAIGIIPPTSAGSDGVISDYSFVNGKIGGAGIAANGGIRFNTSTGYMQIYANSTWNNVVIGFTFEELSDYGYALTHLPTGLTYKIEVMSGNSITNLGLNGLPITQGYITDMGAYPSFQSVGGRTIS